MTKYVVIVDPFSTSSYLPEVFDCHGVECIAVLTKVPVSSRFSASYERSKYSVELDVSAGLEGCIDILKELDVIAVLPGLDRAIGIADILSSELGVHGNAAETSKLRTSKFLMIDALSRAGLLVAKQILAAGPSEICTWAEKENIWPVILKPVDSGGSDSVHLCRSAADISSACQNILGKENLFELVNNCVLAQECLVGTEYVVDSVSLNGQHAVSNVFRYKKESANGSDVVYRAIEAVDVVSDLADVLIEYNNKALDALGVKFGASHSEIMLTERGPALIEVGCRLHGGGIPKIMTRYSDWTQIDLLVDSICDPAQYGKKVESPPSVQKNLVIHHSVAYESGNVVSISCRQQLERRESFREAVWVVKPGDRMRKTIDLETCPAKIVFACDNYSQVIEDINWLIEQELNGKMYAITQGL